MSNIDYTPDYGAYAGQAAAAIKKRANQTLASQQASFWGQQRGQRSLEDLTKKFQTGFNPLLGSLARRGIGKSGITQNALGQYAQSYQRGMDTQNANNAYDQNLITQTETANQDALDELLQSLKVKKAQDILATATGIQSVGAFGG
jgi:hypothetical protein